jgi:hypothetical protein
MRKYIEIPMEVLECLVDGKRVERALRRDSNTGQIVFKAYNRHRQKRNKDQLIAALEHGWLKESPKRVKYYISLKKSIGTARMISAMEREQRVASSHLMDREIVDRV